MKISIERGGRTIAALAVALLAVVPASPAAGLGPDGDVEATWKQPVAAYDDGGSEYAPSSATVVDGVVAVADGSTITRHDLATGAPLAAWNAPAGVTIKAVAAGPNGSLVAVGATGTNGWVGRYDGAATPAWSATVTGAEEIDLVAVDVVGTTAYLGGTFDTSFDRVAYVRRYDGIGAASPTVAWSKTAASGFGDVVHDLAATADAVYAGGSAHGAMGSATVWRFAAANGAVTTKQLDGAAASFFSSEVRGIDADGTRLYVAYSGITRTAAGDAADAHVARLDATTMVTNWEAMVGTTFGPLPALGSQDVAYDVAIDGAGVVLVGSTDSAPAITVDNLVGPGGFIARYTDNGSSGSRQFLAGTAALGTVVVHGDSAIVLTGPTSRGEIDCGGAGKSCTLARIDDGDDVTGEPGFSDVPAGAFYADAVAWLKAEGITTGTSPTTFSPDDAVTRGQMATFLFRFAGEPGGSGSHGFADVAGGAFYADAVAWLKAEGITTGTSPTTFSPDDAVTRGQMATFLFRFAGEPGGSGSHGFADVAGGAFYADAVAWLKAEGITTGTSPTTFSPDDAVTRGQMATFLFRFDQAS